ncbi:MAG: hypothetical protein ABSH15_10615 [Verrucomicrobiota bacterium]|jgi:hypothetical protein
MKPKKILMCAMAVGAMIFAAGKVSAIPGVVNVSGTALTETDSNPSSGIFVGKVTKSSFKTKNVLNLLAQGTETYLDVTTNGWFTNKYSELVYDPDAYNDDATVWYDNEEDVYGIFYVTNTSTHASYRLDGLDIDEDYYSFVEYDSYAYADLTDDGLGFWDDPSLGENYVQSYKENDNKGTYSSKATLQGLLYIHDDPYYFDITDNPYYVFDNGKAFIIRGLGTFNYSDNATKETESFTMSGSGDGYFESSDDSYPVITGKVTFKAKGPSVD